MEAVPDPASRGASKLQPALLRLLRPLVRLLIRHGVTFPALCDMLRELYVNVAEYDFALTGKEQTDSRVSLVTGIHRKEVRRLRGAGAPLTAVPVALSRTSRILGRWLGGSPFVDAEGHPLRLPRTAEGAGPSFEELVMAVTRDVRPRAILDEWLDRKLVTIDADDHVSLLESAYIPQAGDDQQLYYFGRNLHDHMAAAVSNVIGDRPAYLERSVHYDRLSPALAERLQARSRALALDVLRAANAEANAGCVGDEGGTWRWNFGIYIFAEEEPAKDERSSGPGPDL